MEFRPFGKIPRYSRKIVITEKIDGTNASVGVEEFNPFMADSSLPEGYVFVRPSEDRLYGLKFGSRNRWLGPGADDNAGFYSWGCRNVFTLWELGVGHHFGEWWGSGIQRGYGLSSGEKRFSLFNVGRWVNRDAPYLASGQSYAPHGCRVVPIIDTGIIDYFEESIVDRALDKLRRVGSLAAPGFMNPEGIIIFHTAAGSYFKKTLSKDEEHKGQQRG